MPNGSRTFCAECGAKRPAKEKNKPYDLLQQEDLP